MKNKILWQQKELDNINVNTSSLISRNENEPYRFYSAIRFITEMKPHEAEALGIMNEIEEISKRFFKELDILLKDTMKRNDELLHFDNLFVIDGYVCIVDGYTYIGSTLINRKYNEGDYVELLYATKIPTSKLIRETVNGKVTHYEFNTSKLSS